MQSLPWRRSNLIERVREDLWRYLTPAASVGEQILQAAALLQMKPAELRTMGSIQFLISKELRQMLEDMPFLLRRLATTTTSEEEWTVDRIRGSIQWGRTLGLRHTTGIPTLYVTAPTRRAYQTPENEVLVSVLDAAVAAARHVGWIRSQSGPAGLMVREQALAAERWRQSRMLLEVERRSISSRTLARVRSSRYSRRYASVLAAYMRYRSLIGIVDADAVRSAVETYGLATTDDATLLELHVTFEVFGALEQLGWRVGRLGLFEGSLSLTARKGPDQLSISYQSVPRSLGRVSAYRKIQVRHAIAPGSLRPDLTIHHSSKTGHRWILVEVKGGHRPVEKSARAAVFDLLAYHSAFEPLLTESRPYGLGIAWGSDLATAHGDDIVLCTPDRLLEALEYLLGHGHG